MNTDSLYLVVQVSAGSTEEAWTIARTTIERKLVACAQIFPIRSCYEWEGTVVEDNEQLVLMKTHSRAYPALEACIKEIHSYDVPEILALPVAAGEDSYLQWVDDTVVTP